MRSTLARHRWRLAAIAFVAGLALWLVGLTWGIALVVAAYPARPPYPESAIRLLAELAVDQPRRVLDIGCGTGDISRRLAQLVECVDAVDASERMLAAGRRACGGHPAEGGASLRADLRRRQPALDGVALRDAAVCGPA